MAKKTLPHPTPPDLHKLCDRVREKAASYHQYNFAPHHNDFLKAFFDLAQEYNSLDDFYRVIVSVPLEMINISSSLYLCSGKSDPLCLMCSSEEGVLKEPKPATYPVQMHDAPYELEGSYIIPIFSKQAFETKKTTGAGSPKTRQTRLWNNLKTGCGDGKILGMYEVRSADLLTEADKFFLNKYANRIGYNLDNRLIAKQNIEHLKFINTLIIDIEHNIIVPNMYFKHLFRKLHKKIETITAFRDQLSAQQEKGEECDCEECGHKLQQLQDELFAYHQEIVKHHSSTSLFLESLFRREHFERGHLVLQTKRCLIEKDVITPQLEHYANRLSAAGVTVEKPESMHEDELPILVDIGLLAQVYANFFSNAAKYAQKIIASNGTPRKAMAYGGEMIDD